jgi:hypothetical protein
MPIPIGAVLVISGLAALISTSKTVTQYIKKYRRSHPGVDKEFKEVEKRVPKIIRKPLEQTHPD